LSLRKWAEEKIRKQLKMVRFIRSLATTKDKPDIVQPKVAWSQDPSGWYQDKKMEKLF